MATNTKSPRRAKTAAAKPKPTANAKEQAAAAGAQAEAQANAAGEANPASTTSASDPARDAEAAAAAAAAASGTNVAGTEGEVIPPASADKPLEDAAAGNRHSHPAETTAEATLRAANNPQTTAALNAGGNMPAGESANPNGPAGSLDGGAAGAEDGVRKSTQLEDGSVQDATRAAIGAGAGAPDGVGDVGDDPSAAEVVEPVTVGDVTFEGGKAKLWRALEKGGSHDELAAEAGHRSVLGTIYLMARHTNREIEVAKDKKTGVKTYSLKAEKPAKTGKSKD